MTPDPSGTPCPICHRPAVERYRPFCSLRCADADLGRWFSGQYRVPGPAREPDADGDGGRPLDPDGGVG